MCGFFQNQGLVGSVFCAAPEVGSLVSDDAPLEPLDPLEPPAPLALTGVWSPGAPLRANATPKRPCRTLARNTSAFKPTKLPEAIIALSWSALRALT
jgi:hypothetical protein